MVLVKAFPRIHISLLDLGNATARRYGGSGFSIDGNCIEVSATLAQQLQIEGLELVDEAARREIERVITAFTAVCPDGPSFQVCIRRIPPQHVGFGAKTALLLAILTAVNSETGAGLEQIALQRLSGRGGTSGVGVNLYFSGGFVCDLGHPIQSEMPFLPSSASLPALIPPVACRFDIPEKWRFLLILPRGERLAGSQEKLFFQRSTPVPRSEVLEAIAATYHGVVPAIVTADIGLLSSALGTLHRVGFKRMELAAQSDAVRRIYDQLTTIRGLAVGLSSLGPLIYAAADTTDAEAVNEAEAICTIDEATVLGSFPPRNLGYEIAYE